MFSPLTEEQRYAVETLDRPFTLVAAAGSGKTTVLVQRYLSLLRAGRTPWEILTVTFTSEAGQQLRDRISQTLSHDGASDLLLEQVETTPYIGTLHSFCYTILDQYGSALGYRPIERIVQPFELASRFDGAYRQWLEDLSAETLRRFLEHFSHSDLRVVAREWFDRRFLFDKAMAHADRTAHTTPVLNFLQEELAPLFLRLEKELAGQGHYSFDELETYALRILTRSEETRSRLQSDLKNVLVDEFQDTSAMQWSILQAILGKDVKKLFVVGDPKQSIYSFRQANVKLFFSIAEALKDKGGITHELSMNFRSQPELLFAINRIAKQIFTDSEVPFSEMQSGHAPTEKHDTNSDTGGVNVKWISDVASREELALQERGEIVRYVRDLLERGISAREICILFRVSDRIPDYFDHFSREGIPVRCKKTVRLMQCLEVVDVVNFLKTIFNPLDDFALAAFLKSPFVGFTNKDLWELAQGQQERLYEKLLGHSNLSKRVGWLLTIIENGTFEVSPLLRDLFRNAKQWPRRLEPLLELFAPLLSSPLTVAEAIPQILSWEKADILFQTEQNGESKEAVSLMTVHAAKGLEFAHVILADNLRSTPRRTPFLRLSEDLPPGLRFRQEGEWVTTESYDRLSERQHKNDVEESKRILYVALTRPKETLTVFLPQNFALIPKNSWGDWLVRAMVTGIDEPF